MSSRARGLFVVLEGLDGAGTTSQTERIASALRSEGTRVSTTREPSNGPVGVMIRQALTHRVVRPDGASLTAETLALLFAADRCDHVASEIEPGISRGEVVISDRYLLSSLAYQGASVPVEWVAEINRTAREPDLTLFLRVSAKTAAKRRAGRGGRAELFEDDLQQRRIARAYEAAIEAHGRSQRVTVIDGEQDLARVTADCLAAIHTLRARRKRG